MLQKRAMGVGVVLTLVACAETKVPPKEPAAVVAVASASTTPPTPTPVAPDTSPLEIGPVVDVATLLDLTHSEKHVELRVGYDPGGGMSGAAFWFMPIVNGKPDLAQQTGLHSIVSTTASNIEVKGTRPNLYFHQYSGFRGAPSDDHPDGLVGITTYAWSKGRLLEWRGRVGLGALAEAPMLPTFRVVRGDDVTTPSIPPELEKKLTDQVFRTASVSVATTGMVVAVGSAYAGLGFGTLIWRDDLSAPEYLEHSGEEITVDTLQMVGATTRENAWLSTGEELMRLGADGWKVEGRTDDAKPPDMWFGKPLLFEMKKGTFARVDKSGPWRKVVFEDGVDLVPTCLIDDRGVIWTSRGETLYSSAPPAEPLPKITIAMLMAAREASKLEMPYTTDQYSMSPFKIAPKEESPPH